MNYTIHLEGMEFHAFHGCYDLEQVVGNRFRVELKITTPLGEVAEKDDVRLAVNYLTVYELTREVMRQKQRTIERVAVNIISALKAHYPAIVEVTCRVTKLAPPLGGKLEGVSVEITQ